ncbi:MULTISPECIES: MarR family transcriptional regulator [unclassified Lysobacter]|uniref:MarR family winged helix-turn-helix transcriptional regulator n=1 Tax=unclassified Lysobacter TaxID=2635362 RepID=UPI001BEAE645|nr:MULTISPECIES: MarR family transcriptional regulator [unclassified Lysobacter]MBT2750077.1 MarR family transcriptional regulator [Lysobacter sp. ISL-50]
MTKKPSKQAAPDLIDRLVADWKRERPDLDPSAMSVVGRILHLGRLLEGAASEGLRGTGINYTDLDVLATLRRSGAPYRLTPTALRKSVLLTSGAMTACLNRLERAGLISRNAVDEDRRSLAAALTAKGLKLTDKAIVSRFEQARQVVEVLSAGERAELAGLLRKLRSGLPD